MEPAFGLLVPALYVVALLTQAAGQRAERKYAINLMYAFAVLSIGWAYIVSIYLPHLTLVMQG